MMKRSFFLSLLFAAAVGCHAQPPLATPTAAPAPLWTNDERKALVAYWNAPGRYKVEDKPADQPMRVNITTAGSEWYQKFANALTNLRKNNPSQAKEWELWFGRRLNLDMVRANEGMDALANERTGNSHSLADNSLIVDYPRPDPEPPSLQNELGEAPLFYEIVQPKQYTVTFAPTDAPVPFVYTDNLNFTKPRPYYGYYRSTNGVRKFGKRDKDFSAPEKKELADLFNSVASSPFEQHVLAGVSALEGGFEAVNTYDTGWVSIGFIQFITKRDGTGSLASVLAQMKRNDAKDFARTFHRFGIDVDSNTVVSACDPATGTELHGTDAVSALINDKRLTATFERAGSLPGFRKAQIQIARQQYWPGDDTVSVVVHTFSEGTVNAPDSMVKTVFYTPPRKPGDPPAEVQALLDRVPEKQKADPNYRWFLQTIEQTAKVSDLVKSEAGMATLMDRKVNRGNLGNINEVAAQIMQTNKLTNLPDVAKYEKSLIEAMKYRAAFLDNPNLTQPASPPSP